MTRCEVCHALKNENEPCPGCLVAHAIVERREPHTPWVPLAGLSIGGLVLAFLLVNAIGLYLISGRTPAVAATLQTAQVPLPPSPSLGLPAPPLPPVPPLPPALPSLPGVAPPPPPVPGLNAILRSADAHVTRAERLAEAASRRAEAQTHQDRIAAERAAQAAAMRAQRAAESARHRAENDREAGESTHAAATSARRAAEKAARQAQVDRLAAEPAARSGQPNDVAASCAPAHLEPQALLGRLSPASAACLQKQGTANASRVLTLDAFARDDREAWVAFAERTVRLDPAQPDLPYKLALHHSHGSATDALRFAELALDHRSHWTGKTYTERVHALYEVRASALGELHGADDARTLAAREDQEEFQRAAGLR